MPFNITSGQSQPYHSRNTDALIYTVLDENIEEFLKVYFIVLLLLLNY